ncbi:sensor domain-containing diguanylate cyclase [Aeromicrobium wangtongii]|uniref:Sensor domain-containing diguanylate cyclase n=1 Tax=Aeromicrobium wangtongii TaxID=2969247 RepID=A0ABY5MA38_9ACTN|nr:sensor domain-containing diguanylate cyclase [Aeromicrobium wangtongii]MCD9199476.1 sensor domain-containing diguanylate cyclase [Aeromicrobium wangtongii]UUP13829.1 sensor domain-containing diguanylate cyclase [Aeromicrobium wangtongii]
MAHLLAQAHQLDGLIEMAAEHARTALGAASISISRFVPEDDVIKTIINVGDLAPHEVRWPQDETYSLVGYKRLFSTLHERQSWIDSIDDPECEARELELLHRLGKGSCLVTSIVVDGRPWGEFFATRHVGAAVFSQDAIAYAEVLAAILASAVARAIREAALEDLASRDPLTGLLNRRALDDRAAQVFDLGEQASRQVVIVAVDIDGLKQVNDSQGHAQGDAVIRHTAAALMSAFEPVQSNLVARVGGDEFTVLVWDGDAELVEKTVNTVCETVDASDLGIGLSAGLAAAVLTPESSLTVTEMFAAADRAQYVAKRTQSCVAVIADDVSA